MVKIQEVKKLVDCVETILKEANMQLIPGCDGSKPMIISSKPKGNYDLKLPFPGCEIYLTLDDSDDSDEKVSFLVFKYFLNKIYNSIIPYVFHLHLVKYITEDMQNFREDMFRAAIENIEEDINNTYGVDFSAIDHISLMQYEGENDCGRIFFGRNVSERDIKSTCSVILLEKQFSKSSKRSISSFEIEHPKFEVKNSKYIRKLISGGGNGELGLAFNWTSCTDAPVCCGYLCPDKERSFNHFPVEVIIKNSLEYSLYINNAHVYHKHNEAYTVKENDGIDEVVAAIKKLSFKEIKCVDAIKEILTELKGQKHGTSVIFVSDDKRLMVAKRLSLLVSAGRALPVLCDEIKGLKYLSRMDGAIVVQVSDTCRISLINVILDGLCISKGEPSRGARYNVVSNFVNGLNKNGKIEVVGAVLSSDGNKFEAII